MTTSGITSGSHDVKLTTVSGDLALNQAVNTGTANLTLNVTGSLTQTASITASGLQLLGSGTSVALNNANNDVTTVASVYSGLVNSNDNNALAVGTVSDANSRMTTIAITSSSTD